MDIPTVIRGENMKNILKPCPFCGRDATTQTRVVRGITADCIKFSVCCPACHIEQHIDIESNDSFEAVQKAMDKAIKA